MHKTERRTATSIQSAANVLRMIEFDVKHDINCGSTIITGNQNVSGPRCRRCLTLMTGWVVLLVAQTGLIAAHRVQWHRRLWGRAGCALRINYDQRRHEEQKTKLG
jgi:hypothetical protein